MKCKHCGQEIVRVVTAQGPVVCNAPAVAYWLTDSPDTEILTPNGESIYCTLAGKPNEAHGIGYTKHTCFQITGGPAPWQGMPGSRLGRTHDAKGTF